MLKMKRNVRMGNDFMKIIEDFKEDRFNRSRLAEYDYTITWKSSNGATLTGIYSPKENKMISLDPYEVFKHYKNYPRERVKFHIAKDPMYKSKSISVGLLMNIHITVERHKVDDLKNS